ncbi:MAG: hypothetical protein K2L55_02125, partial [Muribaculaceae bacterium]|nr:hypothetical protein [Muribaculaceae bacterium]
LPQSLKNIARRLTALRLTFIVEPALNFGNALGAYFGGLPIAAGYGAKWSSLVGAAFSLLGVGFILYFKFRAGKRCRA